MDPAATLNPLCRQQKAGPLMQASAEVVLKKVHDIKMSSIRGGALSIFGLNSAARSPGITGCVFKIVSASQSVFPVHPSQ